jgi:Ca2+-binding EF-hand superfamily protein
MTMRVNPISIEQENSRYLGMKIILIFIYVLDIELKEAFALFDRVGGGVIRTKDLAYVMHSIGYQTTPSELEQMIREVDQDGLLNSH